MISMQTCNMQSHSSPATLEVGPRSGLPPLRAGDRSNMSQADGRPLCFSNVHHFLVLAVYRASADHLRPCCTLFDPCMDLINHMTTNTAPLILHLQLPISATTCLKVAGELSVHYWPRGTSNQDFQVKHVRIKKTLAMIQGHKPASQGSRSS